jgi:hypothetical protein
LPPVPVEVEEVIGRGLAMDVGRRYSTAVEFRDDLARCLAAAGVDDEGVVRNLMFTMLTAAADASAPAPALRTPAGEVDRMIGRLRALVGSPALHDVVAPAPKQNAPAQIVTDRMTRVETGSPKLSTKDIESITRILRRRVGLRSYHHLGADAREDAMLEFLRWFADVAEREGNPNWLLNTMMPLRTAANLLNHLSTDELALIGTMLRAVGEGRAALSDWLAAHWH